MTCHNTITSHDGDTHEDSRIVLTRHIFRFPATQEDEAHVTRRGGVAWPLGWCGWMV